MRAPRAGERFEHLPVPARSERGDAGVQSGFTHEHCKQVGGVFAIAAAIRQHALGRVRCVIVLVTAQQIADVRAHPVRQRALFLIRFQAASHLADNFLTVDLAIAAVDEQLALHSCTDCQVRNVEQAICSFCSSAGGCRSPGGGAVRFVVFQE